MHWIQTVRENLQLSQEELAIYLRLSVDMVKSVEVGRRQLPFESMAPAIAIHDAMKDCQARGPTGDATTSERDHLRELKRLHNKYRRRLEDAIDKLEKMKRTYESSSLRFEVYRDLANGLAAAVGKDDLARLRWINVSIDEAKYCMKDNNATAQAVQSAKIAGLKAAMQAVEKMLG